MAPSAPQAKTHQIPIFIDGEKHTAQEAATTAAILLGLVSKSSSEYYLVLKEGRQQTEFRGDDPIELKPGSHFLTVFTGPTPVS
jgi:hypothetical protein